MLSNVSFRSVLFRECLEATTKRTQGTAHCPIVYLPSDVYRSELVQYRSNSKVELTYALRRPENSETDLHCRSRAKVRPFIHRCTPRRHIRSAQRRKTRESPRTREIKLAAAFRGRPSSVVSAEPDPSASSYGKSQLLPLRYQGAPTAE